MFGTSRSSFHFLVRTVLLQFTNKKDEMLRKKSGSSSESDLQAYHMDKSLLFKQHDKTDKWALKLALEMQWNAWKEEAQKLLFLNFDLWKCVVSGVSGRWNIIGLFHEHFFFFFIGQGSKQEVFEFRWLVVNSSSGVQLGYVVVNLWM